MSITISVLLVVHNNIYAQTIEHVLHTKVRPQIKVGNYPIDIEVNKDTNKIYVANYKSRSISVIDSDSGNIKNIPVGVKPRSIAIDDRSNNIYVANLGSGLLSIIDGYNDSTIKQIHVGTAPLNILYDDFSSKEDVPTIYNKIYVTNSASKPVGSVTVINGSTYEKEKNDIQVGKLPSAIAIDPRTNVIYIANRNSNNVTAINGITDKVIRNISVGKNPFAIAFDSKNNKTYVVNQGSNSVTVINGHTYKTEAPIHVGKEPWAIAIDTKRKVIYVTNRGDNTVTAIDGTTDKVIRNISVGKSPTDIAVDSTDNKIYAANIDSNTVSVVNGSTYNKTDINVGSNPFRIAYNSRTNMIYVVNRGSNSVSAIDASSNKVAVGVIFNVKPPDSGTVLCDNQSGTNQIEYPINGYIYVDNGTRCTGQGKNNYQFDRWVLDLGHNSSLTINDASDLRVDRYGNFTAYFKPVPPSVPPQYWSLIITVVLTTIVGWSIPGVIGWIRATIKRKESVKEYDDIVASLSNATDRQKLDRIKNQVIRAHISEKINEFQYNILDKKISYYYDFIDKSNNSANQRDNSRK